MNGGAYLWRALPEKPNSATVSPGRVKDAKLESIERQTRQTNGFRARACRRVPE
jgi:hypothetical protein